MVLYKFLALYLSFTISIVFSFTPDTSSFDSYGLKLAVNDILLVEALPLSSSFFLRLAPYNYSLSCTIPYNDSNQYVFSVALDSQATYNDPIRFVFNGINTVTDVPFIGSLTYTGVTGPQYAASTNSSRRRIFPCGGWQVNNYQIQQLEQFVHNDSEETINNDFFVITIAPNGQFAYAFTKDFLLIYNINNNIISTQLGNITWPDPSFLPHAVDVSDDFLIVVVGYNGSSDTKYTPCAYLLNIANSTFNVVDTWLYTPPTNTSWQATLTNWDADVYAPKYDMSVSMSNDGSQVVLGIQITNTVILVTIDRINQNFGLSLQILSNGKGIGMGKALGWYNANSIFVLVNTYSFNYIWSSSQVVAYDITVANSSSVISIFPNIQQTLSSEFGPILLSVVVTQNGTVVILDSDGDYYIIHPAPAGSYADTSSGASSSSLLCFAGTFTLQAGVFPCSLCPPDTTTAGLIGQSSCVPCNNDAFCSLGAAFGNINLSSPLLMSASQTGAYPVSPQSIRFDNILIANMFAIHASKSSHCLVVSPLFWAIMVIFLGVSFWVFMFILKRCVNNPMGQKVHQDITELLKKTDLIGEGEMVLGGLFSFAIVVLLAFAFSFSHSYLNRYPIEKITGDANFACDTTLINAQFSSGLMALGIPPNDEEIPMFDVLNDQQLTMYMDFINAAFNCTDITVTQIKDISLPMPILSCNETDSTTSVSFLLPSHDVSLQVQLTGINTIGGIRIRLEGSGLEIKNETLNSAYTLVNLSFAQALWYPGRVFTQQPSCTIQLTKVINLTYSLEAEGENEFSGIWLPIISGDLDRIFVDASEYKYGTSSNTIFSIVISETSSYMLNTQRPITDQDEVIFSDLLFSILCLELFGLGFLIVRLIIMPLVKQVWKRSHAKSPPEKSRTENADADFQFVIRM